MAGLDDGSIRYVERQTGDDHVPQALSPHVHPLPEAERSQQDRPPVVAKPLEQQPRPPVRPVHEQGMARLDQLRANPLGDLVHQAEAREEHERPAVRLPHQPLDARREQFDVLRIARRGHRPVHDHPHLAGVVERAAQPEGLDLVTPEAARDVGEVARPGGHGRRGQNHRDLQAEEMLAEERGHIDGHALQDEAPPPARPSPRRHVRSLQEVDASLDPLLEEQVRVAGDLGRPHGVAVQLVPVGVGGDLRPQQLQPLRQLLHRGGEHVPDDAGVRDAPVGGAVIGAPAQQVVEERLARVTRPPAAFDHLIDERGGAAPDADAGEEPPTPPRVVEEPQEMGDAGLGEAEAEVLGRDLLDAVRLVEDDVVVGRQEADAVDAEGEVGEEEGVVADEQIAVLHPPPRRLVEAPLVGRAFPAHAVVGVAPGVVPHLRLRQDRKGRARAVVGGVCPVLERVQRRPGALVGKEPVLALAGEPQASNGHVVPAPLDEHRAELVGDDRVQQRNVPLDELFLEVDRVRDDDDALVVVDDSLDGGNEIGERLPDAGARLHEQSPSPVERALDRRRHLQLLRPGLEPLEPAGDGSPGRQQTFDVDLHGFEPAARRRRPALRAAVDCTHGSRRSGGMPTPSFRSARRPPRPRFVLRSAPAGARPGAGDRASVCV